MINIDHPMVSRKNRTHARGHSSKKRAQALIEKFKSLGPLPRIHAMRVTGMINVGPVEVHDPRTSAKFTKSRIATLLPTHRPVVAGTAKGSPSQTRRSESMR